LESGKGKASNDFYTAKIQTAEFYFARLLPRADSHYSAALAPTSSVMQMPRELFQMVWGRGAWCIWPPAHAGTAPCPPPHATHSHSHAGGQAGAKPKLYNPRHPERTLLYQTIAEHFETWHELASAGQFDGQGDHHTPKPYVRQAFRKYLECGIFAHGFARAWFDDCGHDYFVAYSCKGRGVCPSCNTRRMVETAAHLTDHVFPRLPVRQWVLSVPKRLRYFMRLQPERVYALSRLCGRRGV